MAVINRAALAEHLWPGIIHFFGAEYKDYEPQWSHIYDTRKSGKAYEEYVMESMFGLASEKEAGAPVMFDDAADSWKGRVEMVAYALGFVITREAVADDQYFDLVPRYTKALKRSMVITKEVRAAAFLDASFSTSRTGDGVAIIAGNHPLKSGDTFSNIAGANADLNETSLESAIIQIADFVDERGLRINVRPRKLVVPNGLQFTAERLMRTTQGRVGTADNDVAAIHTMGMIPEGYCLNNYLSDPDAWFLKNDVPEGMTYWDRESLDIDQGDGLDNQVMKVLAYERYSFSCMDPRSMFGSPGQPT
jgi:hypothetical protein